MLIYQYAYGRDYGSPLLRWFTWIGTKSHCRIRTQNSCKTGDNRSEGRYSTRRMDVNQLSLKKSASRVNLNADFYFSLGTVLSKTA